MWIKMANCILRIGKLLQKGNNMAMNVGLIEV